MWVQTWLNSTSSLLLKMKKCLNEKYTLLGDILGGRNVDSLSSVHAFLSQLNILVYAEGLSLKQR